MNAYTPFRALLLSSTAITSMVDARIYKLRPPQKSLYPAIVLTRVTGLRVEQLRGQASAAEPRMQVDCYATTSDQAEALGALCRQQVDRYNGLYTFASASPQVTIRVQIEFKQENDLFDEGINGGMCRHSVDYRYVHSTAGGLI